MFFWTCFLNNFALISTANRQPGSSYWDYFTFTASDVSYRRWNKILGDDGGRQTKNRRFDGPSSGLYRPYVKVSNLCRKHDRVSWALRTHRTGQTCLSYWFLHKNYQDSTVCLFLLLQTPGRLGKWPCFTMHNLLSESSIKPQGINRCCMLQICITIYYTATLVLR